MTPNWQRHARRRREAASGWFGCARQAISDENETVGDLRRAGLALAFSRVLIETGVALMPLSSPLARGSRQPLSLPSLY
jgi:hypothetical protein